MAPRTCAAYNHRNTNQDQRDRSQNPADDIERLKYPVGGLQPRVKRRKPGEERQQRKNRRGDGEGRYRRHPHHGPFNMLDRLVRFILELEFGGCERLIQASRYGSLPAHEFTNRRAQTCDVIAKRREFGGAIYLEPLSPIIDFPLGLLLRVTVTLLKEAEQFGIFAFDDFNILISQLAPLPFDFAFQLVPAAFDFVPAHGIAPLSPIEMPAAVVMTLFSCTALSGSHWAACGIAISVRFRRRPAR